jgi:hypothetical protein
MWKYFYLSQMKENYWISQATGIPQQVDCHKLHVCWDKVVSLLTREMLYPQGSPIKVHSVSSSKHIKMVPPLCMLWSHAYFNYSWSIVSCCKDRRLCCNNTFNTIQLFVLSELSIITYRENCITGSFIIYTLH